MDEKTTPTPRRRRTAPQSTESGNSNYNRRFSAGEWRAILEEVGRERYEQLRVEYLKSR